MSFTTPGTWKQILQLPRWDVVTMLILFAAIFSFEMLGVLSKHFVTITGIIRASIPRWARWMVIGWLTYHFGVE